MAQVEHGDCWNSLLWSRDHSSCYVCYCVWVFSCINSARGRTVTDRGWRWRTHLVNICMCPKTGPSRTSYMICPHLVQALVSALCENVTVDSCSCYSSTFLIKIYIRRPLMTVLIFSEQVYLCLSSGPWPEQLSSKKSLVKVVLGRCGGDVGGVVTWRWRSSHLERSDPGSVRLKFIRLSCSAMKISWAS